ncbi:MAG: RNA-directed DNA polymerase [Oceanospirillaceae bacterium]|nr:RNA-directed DNA polymerase [Oceanospirillaceae bacterium]
MIKNLIKKPKITSKNKSYDLTDCCLYKVGSLKKLAQLLCTDLTTLNALRGDGLYNIFLDNGRTIEQPILIRDLIHTRIASLLIRVTPSDSLHSGIKKRSHITNAQIHLGHHPLLTSDIRSFFQSTTKESIFRFFQSKLKCSKDVSDLLSDICTCQGHVPTGSRISMVIAYWANKPMFDEWESLAAAKNLNFSIFVDDITFSGHGLNRSFVSLIKKIAIRHGHVLHPNKTKLYRSDSIKNVTGTSIDGEKLTISQKNRHKLYSDMVLWHASDKSIPHETLENKILGKLTAQSQIDPRYKDKARSFRNQIKKRGKI